MACTVPVEGLGRALSHDMLTEPGGDQQRDRLYHLGFGRIVTSEIEVSNMLAIPV